MPTVETSIDIDLPPGELYDLAVRPSTIEMTNAAIVELDVDWSEEAKPEVGQQMRLTAKVVGRKLASTNRVTEAERGKVYASESVDSPIAFTVRYTYEDLGDGKTRLHFLQEAESFGGFFGKLADPVVLRMYSKTVDATLESLKELAESR